MPFQIVRNDIVRVRADAIVNTANPEPVIGGGTDAAIYAAAGREDLLRARQSIGEILPGRAAVTPAFSLPARYIIHTVGPVWIDGSHQEIETLASCYRESLIQAEACGCESVAFPLISTGTYGFPRDKALETAISVISGWLLTHEMTVTLVVFDRKAFTLSGQVFRSVEAFIDENYVANRRREEYGRRHSAQYERDYRRRLMARRAAKESFSLKEDMDVQTSERTSANSAPSAPELMISAEIAGSLEEMLAGAGATFQQKLLQLIDARDMSDATVYKRANLDRKLFSKIRCNADYRPKKKTAVALAIALKLTIEETRDLLQRAEIALSPSSKFDLIITWFIENRNYDIYEINLALFEYDQPLLGA